MRYEYKDYTIEFHKNYWWIYDENLDYVTKFNTLLKCQIYIDTITF